jgi:hypothetical protein
MRRKGLLLKICIVVLVAFLVLALPTTALAQDDDPPPEEPVEAPGVSEDDILIFEPQLYLEFPFNQGFKIILNFGISFEVPRRLLLVDNNILNFFLKFESFIRPAETAPEAGD